MKEIQLEISVIILTYHSKIKLLLEGFCHQTFDKNSYEIIIVDDGTPGITKEYFNDYYDRLNLKVNIIEHTGNRGLNGNIGFQQARGKRVLFVDGDIIPSPQFIERHHMATKDDSLAISLAMRTYMQAEDESRFNVWTVKNYFEEVETFPGYPDNRVSILKHMNDRGFETESVWMLFWSHNFCIWKDTFSDIGGFDSNFEQFWGLEDFDLGYRLVQKGCRLKYLSDLDCYHINHVEPVKNNYDLKTNSLYFYRKYNNWETELHTFLGNVLYIPIIEIHQKVFKQNHIAKNMEPALLSTCTDNSAILFGVEDSRMLADNRVKYVLCPNSSARHEKIVPLFGIRTDFKDKEFALGVISSRYQEFGTGFFELLVREVSRICQQICFQSESEIVSDSCIKAVGNGYIEYKETFKCNFVLTQYSSGVYKNYVHNLAYNLSKRGAKVSIRDENGSSLVCKDFLHIQSSEKKERLYNLYETEICFFDEEYPTLIDFRTPYTWNRALGRCFYWGESISLNTQYYFNPPLNPYFSYGLYRKDMDYQVYASIFNQWGGNALMKLPVGIDTQLIKKYKKELQKSALSFVAVAMPVASDQTGSMYGSSLAVQSNIVELIEAFKKCLSKNPDICLTVIANTPFGMITDNDQIEYDLFTNKTLLLSQKNKKEIERMNFLGNLCTIKEMIRDIPNITVVSGDFSEEQIMKEIAAHHVCIDVDPLVQLNPVVMIAAALGKKIIRPNDGVYKDYLGKEFFVDLAYKSITGMRFGFEWYGADTRHFVVKKIESDSIAEQISLFANQIQSDIPEASIDYFCTHFDWNVIAEKFMSDYSSNSSLHICKQAY